MLIGPDKTGFGYHLIGVAGKWQWRSF